MHGFSVYEDCLMNPRVAGPAWEGHMSIIHVSMLSVCRFVASCATAPRVNPLSLPMATSPESVGMSSAKLANIETITAQHIESGMLPGAVMLVARKGQIAWF